MAVQEAQWPCSSYTRLRISGAAQVQALAMDTVLCSRARLSSHSASLHSGVSMIPENGGTWLINSELANQHARKVLFTCVVYTNNNYFIQMIAKI